MIGTSLNQYRITASIGAGGMGEVFRARDTRLNRDVAVKVLPKDFLADADRLRRFEQEAKTLAVLNHPNVLTIHDAGVHEGAPYLVSELLEGKTLREEMNGGALPVRKATDYALQIAHGLAAAHGKSVIHRDLKPENIFLTKDGRVKILDFGLAKLRAPLPIGREPGSQEAATIRIAADVIVNTTEPGMVLGTPAYMSPEQVRGEPADHRADIFAFGCVLYEMLSGTRAFRRNTPVESMNAVLNDIPPELSTTNPNISLALARIVERCLEKQPDNRFQSAKDLTFALAEFPSARPSTPSCRDSDRTAWKRSIAVAIGVLLVALSAGLFLKLRSHSGSSSLPLTANAPARIASLAVKPLDDFSGDTNNAYLSDGMTEALCAALGNISSLRVPGRSSVMRYKNTQKSIREIAKELNVDALVEGSIQLERAGNRMIIIVRLVEAATDRQLWATNYARDLSEFFKVQSEVARAIADEVQVRLTPEDQARLAKKHTTNPEATELYLNGRFQMFQMTETGFKRAVALFDQAVAKDPAFALAYAAKAEAYAVVGHSWFVPPGEATAIMRRAATNAVGLDDSLAEAHLALAITKMVECDWQAADQEFQRSIELNPRHGLTRTWYGGSLCFRGQLDQADEQLKLARALEPLSAFVAVQAGWPSFWRRHYDESLVEFQRAVALEPNLFFAHEWVAWVHVQKKNYKDAIEALQKALTVSDRHQEVIGFLGYTYGVAGDPVEARKLLEELNTRAKTTRYSCPVYPAMIHAALGETNQAFALLQQAAKDRDINVLVFGKGHPCFDRLRADPRYPALLRQVGLEK